METKLEALAALIIFKVLAENAVARFVKVLHTDRGEIPYLNSDMMLGKDWSGRKPTVDYFRNFGCIAYAHVPNKKSKKSRRQIPVDFNNGEDLTVQNTGGQMQQNGGLTSIDLEASRKVDKENLPAAIEFNIGESLPTTPELESGTNCDSLTYEKAIIEEKWQKGMAEEIGSIERNQTYELIDLPKGHKTIGVKWIYKTKLNENGEVDKFKARLVVKGYKQEFSIDYQEVFAPVARMDTIRLVISLAAYNSWPIY
ncbi:hypothetical protein SLEP1_g12621 [Rubroshorea leprosula]|uniref:Reverse transcriptase Ty1/copia-type domain-containing protein n=1 Tax=Rubroshorea leprosula TaxID=152421 RepID=A0AAV5IMK2_9ROSI|nr:hypothetical protein SLEP1_g12621 [Rubroshorea leprosula]